MRFRHLLFPAVAMILLSGCNKTPDANYQQAIESNLVETDANGA